VSDAEGGKNKVFGGATGGFLGYLIDRALQAMRGYFKKKRHTTPMERREARKNGTGGHPVREGGGK